MLRRAQAWPEPAATWTTSSRPEAGWARERSTKLPSPSWPRPPAPQHWAVPPAAAQEKPSPLLRSVASVRLRTVLAWPSSAPAGSRPAPRAAPSLLPQHWTVPVRVRAQVWWPPAATAVTGEGADGHAAGAVFGGAVAELAAAVAAPAGDVAVAADAGVVLAGADVGDLRDPGDGGGGPGEALAPAHDRSGAAHGAGVVAAGHEEDRVGEARDRGRGGTARARIAQLARGAGAPAQDLAGVGARAGVGGAGRDLDGVGEAGDLHRRDPGLAPLVAELGPAVVAPAQHRAAAAHGAGVVAAGAELDGVAEAADGHGAGAGGPRAALAVAELAAGVAAPARDRAAALARAAVLGPEGELLGVGEVADGDGPRAVAQVAVAELTAAAAAPALHAAGLAAHAGVVASGRELEDRS